MRIIVKFLPRRSRSERQRASRNHYCHRVLVVNRFRVTEDDAERFRAALEAALAVLAQQKGYADGQLGRNVDDPSLWVMVTRWQDVGCYRRALSSYDVKV